MTNDEAGRRSSRTAAGLGFALVSAASFGLSGPLARGLLEAGWSAGAAVTVRLGVAVAVLIVPGVFALGGQWQLLRRNAILVIAYGVLAVAGCQLCYFYAVQHLEVGVALLIEYTAPVAVVLWVWLRYGHRPGALTVVGALLASLGLVLVLDAFSGATLNLVGVLWGLGAMLGVAVYFVISADEGNGLPPLVLAASGLVVGTLTLLVAGVVGIVPLAAKTAEVSYRGWTGDWWLPVLALGLVTAALAYTTGIAAGRRLGPRLTSFVGLTEVLAALVFAWLLLDELPGWVQLAGGLLIVAGVVVVKLGEGRGPRRAAPSAHPGESLSVSGCVDGSVRSAHSRGGSSR